MRSHFYQVTVATRLTTLKLSVFKLCDIVLLMILWVNWSGPLLIFAGLITVEVFHCRIWWAASYQMASLTYLAVSDSCWLWSLCYTQHVHSSFSRVDQLPYMTNWALFQGFENRSCKATWSQGSWTCITSFPPHSLAQNKAESYPDSRRWGNSLSLLKEGVTKSLKRGTHPHVALNLPHIKSY